ncbi:uncharacterized protein LOC122504520 isoform X2 [Leptopilina heterotoma]|uniref:uncharacterized protein LOC122504520 isoform X2 n=1 Tax=Leptopilina heterotoma TaxID=63436 RepID=UPI001CA7D2FD|nr:uncharacterized protein LOC122504520 isoform X2 [Leptopilina heterotoma]
MLRVTATTVGDLRKDKKSEVSYQWIHLKIIYLQEEGEFSYDEDSPSESDSEYSNEEHIFENDEVEIGNLFIEEDFDENLEDENLEEVEGINEEKRRKCGSRDTW